jgi:hypothetical protein
MAEENKTKLRQQSMPIDENATVQEIHVSPNFTKFMGPFRMVLCGSSQIGKTRLLVELIKYREQVFNIKFSRIIYSIPDSNIGVNTEVIKSLRTDCPNIEIESEFQSAEQWNLIPNLSGKHVLLCIEDQYPSLAKSANFETLLISHSHHHSVSCIVTSQNYFLQSSRSTTLLRNFNYTIAFSARDGRRLSIELGSRISSNAKCLEEAFKWMRENPDMAPLQYVVIDASAQSHLPRALTLRSQITPVPPSDVINPIFFSLQE